MDNKEKKLEMDFSALNKVANDITEGREEGKLYYYSIKFLNEGYHDIELPVIVVDSLSGEVVNKKEFIEAKLQVSELLNITIKRLHEMEINDTRLVIGDAFYNSIVDHLNILDRSFTNALDVMSKLEYNIKLSKTLTVL